MRENELSEPVKKRFGNIPYLNSSLFEPNELGHKTIRISNLEDELILPVLPNTVLTDRTGERVKDEKTRCTTCLNLWMLTIFPAKAPKKSRKRTKRSSMRRCWD
jgi:hypothetical protein